MIYTVDFAIEVEASAKSMALHEAGTRWPELDEHIRGVASDIAIKRIRVEGDKTERGEE